MAVTSFDGSFSFKQDSLARLGERANNRPGMSPEEYNQFQNSPFMQTMRKIEELTYHKVTVRDKKRAQTDSTFCPRDEDFEAPKSFKYDKVMNYYKTLGVDEYAPQKNVKDAYKRLSLVYHPDKTAGLSSEVKEEYGQIFIELKNAYQTLVDNPTRRQYDRDRDKDIAAFELNGWKIKERAQFDAKAFLEKMQQEAASKGPSKVIELEVKCRLEKFFYSGHKAIRRKRTMMNKKKGTWTEDRLYRIDVPRGHEEPFVAEFRRQGDQHEESHADTLRFLVTSKPHQVVQRQGQDLRLRYQVEARQELYLSAQAPSIRGRHLLLWGLNPFFGHSEAGPGELSVRVVGEGLGETGALAFTVRVRDGPVKDSGAAPQSLPSNGKSQGEDESVVITVRNMATEAVIWLLVTPSSTIGQVRRKAQQVLGLKASSTLKLLQGIGAGRFTPYADSATVGSAREFQAGGSSWGPVTFTLERAMSFLEAVVKLCEAPDFRHATALAAETPDPAARSAIADKLWAAHERLLPEYGLQPSAASLLEAVSQARKQTQGKAAAKELLGKLDAYRSASIQALSGPSSKPQATSPAAAESPARAKTEAAKAFVQRFGLAPAGGFRGAPREPPPAVKRRLLRRAKRELQCEVQLSRLGAPVTLYTKPTCRLTFYTNFEASVEATSGRVVEPCTLFAASLSSPACSRGKAASSWDRLQCDVLPLVQLTAFRMLRAGRAVLPRPLAAFPAPAAAVRDGAQDARPVPWKLLGGEAFRQGDFWWAAALYSRGLEELPKESGARDGAVILSNRSGCYAKAGDYSASLEDARRACELSPGWAKAWVRTGLAAAALGSTAELAEARAAYFKAVELEPAQATLATLHEIVGRQEQPSTDAAHAAKERGNECTRVNEWSTAVAHYTVALALVPPDESEEISFLRCVILSNRSAAFSRLRNWHAAVDDAQKAVQAKEDFAKAHCRLGVALLGSKQCEPAYVHFAKALLLQEEYPAARRGRNEALGEMLRWRSPRSQARLQKRLADAKRPKGSTRVFSISNVHFDHRVNEDWAHAIDDSAFQEDVLIVVGNLADTRGAIVRGLTTLRAKFRRVFYTVGSHEMWVLHGDMKKYPDSIAKLQGIFEACDELGVDVVSDAVCEDVFVAPIHSWYNAEFDERDPWPDPQDNTNPLCRWPLDPDDQVWKFMLKLNEGFLGLPYHGTVITFSHFLPRRNLPVPEMHGKPATKVAGCERIDDQVRAVRSKVHIYAHSYEKYSSFQQGIHYVNHPLNTDDQMQIFEDSFSPMLMIYDGRSVCMRPADISGQGLPALSVSYSDAWPRGGPGLPGQPAPVCPLPLAPDYLRSRAGASPQPEPQPPQGPGADAKPQLEPPPPQGPGPDASPQREPLLPQGPGPDASPQLGPQPPQGLGPGSQGEAAVAGAIDARAAGWGMLQLGWLLPAFISSTGWRCRRRARELWDSPA